MSYAINTYVLIGKNLQYGKSHAVIIQLCYIQYTYSGRLNLMTAVPLTALKYGLALIAAHTHLRGDHIINLGAQWLSGRVLDSRLRGCGFGPNRRHCVVSFSKNINPSLVLVQHRKTRTFITERLLMGCKESNKKTTTLIELYSF